MGWSTQTKMEADLGSAETGVTQGGLNLYMPDVQSRLDLRTAGLCFDTGSRLGLVHPYMDTRQNVRYYHKHLCSADRGTSPQWPRWSMIQDLMEVDIDYALRHDDLPVLDIGPGCQYGDVPYCDEGDTALVMRPTMDDVEKIGWANMFWHLLKANIPGITTEWLASTFRVSMDWYGGMRLSPLASTWVEGVKNGWVPTCTSDALSGAKPANIEVVNR